MRMTWVGSTGKVRCVIYLHEFNKRYTASRSSTRALFSQQEFSIMIYGIIVVEGVMKLISYKIARMVFLCEINQIK